MNAVTCSSRWRFCLLGAAGLLVLGTLTAVFSSNRSHSGERALPPAAERIAANGVVEGASRERALVPEVAGILGAVHVEMNQEVAAGTLLFELQNASQRAQVSVAEAELASAQAQLQHASIDYQRQQDLLRQHAVSKADFETQRYRLLSNQARAREVEARLQLAQAELAKTQVRAPMAGRVLHIHKEPGMLVGPVPGQLGRVEPVLVIADVSRRRVRAFVEELDCSRVQSGQPAVVTADGFAGREFSGKVREVASRMGKDAPQSDSPGEYRDVYYREVVIELDAGAELLVNLRVQVRIDVAAAR